MRVFIAGLIGGIVFFLWTAVAHMFLPIGEMGMRAPTDETAIVTAMQAGLPGEGVYYLPYLSPAQMQDEAVTTAYAERAARQPYAFVIYQPQGRNNMAMGPYLATQFASNTLAALIVAFVLALGSFAFSQRVFIATALGLFSWLCISVPYWNWYRFPLDFTLGALLEQVIGWLVAGVAMAWWLGRHRR